jgi:hypothetical protein
VHDDAAAGLGDRGKHRVLVIGLERGKVDHLGVDAFRGKLIGGRKRLLHHRAPADQRDIAALAQHEGDIERQGLAIVQNLALGGAIDAGRLEEHDRVGIADRGKQQPIGALRRGRHHDTQPGNVGEHGFGRLRMMLGRPDAGAMGRAQHHRAGESSLRAVAQPRGVVHQLIDARIQKTHELDLADRPQPLRRHADAQPADEKLGERRVDDALRAKTLLQADRRAEHATIDAHVLAEHDDIRIIAERAAEREVDGVDERHLSHAALP